MPPSVAPVRPVQSPTPTLSSLADDTKIKEYVHSVLASMLNQPGSQVNLGFNPFISAPLEVPDIPSQESTGGRGSESLIRGRFASPSGVVPPPSEDVMPPNPMSVPFNVVSSGLDRFSGSPFPPLGDSTPVNVRPDQLRDRSDLGFTQHVIAADVHHVLRSVSSFDPTSLLFPFSDSGFSSMPPPTPVSSLPSVSSLSSTTPSSTVPLFSLPSVVPSALPHHSLPSSVFSAPSSSFSLPLSSLPSSVSSFSVSQPAVTPLVSAPSSSSVWFSSLPPPPSSSAVPPAVSSPPGDFAPFHARVLGFSDEYQALGRWFVASRGSDFPSYLSAHFLHLYSDFRLDFASGSFHFLSALAASPPTPPPSSALFSSPVTPSAPLLPHPPVSSLPPAPSSSSLSFSWRPMAPGTPSASALPSAPPLPSSVAPAASAPPCPFSLGDCSWAPGSSLGFPGSLGFLRLRRFLCVL